MIYHVTGIIDVQRLAVVWVLIHSLVWRQKAVDIYNELFLLLSFNERSFWIDEDVLSKSYCMFPQYIKHFYLIESRKIGLLEKWPQSLLFTKNYRIVRDVCWIEDGEGEQSTPINSDSVGKRKQSNLGYFHSQLNGDSCADLNLTPSRSKTIASSGKDINYMSMHIVCGKHDQCYYYYYYYYYF